MFHYLDKYARNDVLVKLIFDHLKNIGVIILILGAAAWKQKHMATDWTAIWDILVSASLGFAGLGLMWMNHENLFHKIRESSISNRLKLAFGILYAIIFAQLYHYIAAGKA